MDLLKKKKIIFSCALISILFFSFFFIYSKNLRSQYSDILTSRAEFISGRYPKRSLALYTLSSSLVDNDKAKFGMGKLYLSSGLYDKAELNIRAIKDQSLISNAFSSYLKEGYVEKGSYLIDKLSATDENLYNNTIYAVWSGKDLPDCKSEPKCIKAQEELKNILANKNESYKNTAIASFLYKADFKNLALMKLESKEFNDYRDYNILIGKIYEEKGLYKKSATALNNAIELDPYNYEIKTLLEKIKSKEVKKDTIAQKELKITY